MKVQLAIQKRRSYRGLEPIVIADNMIKELATAASLAPSCYNNQPWKFIFVRSKEQLKKMKAVMNKGNEWTFSASCIIAVMSKKELDCVIKDREYYLFDTGLGVGQLLLKATELGLVTHVIAGYSPDKTKEILNVPEEWNVIALIALGKKSKKKKIIGDESRPERLALQYVYSIDEYSKKLNKKVKH
ncbi:MAG: nitroreductase family protein [Candidatus Delongbacteria bacterium]|nr:nitroreductase family protein [Candidatus Delongbacteria bacterium]MCG2760951.1 nitroreductase family protein [Candidatus Delongbacteria bacterium]